MTYGCFNRPPFAATTTAQDGWYDSGPRRKMQVPFRMEPACRYTLTSLGEADKNCAGCGWRNPQQQPTKETT